MIISLRWLFTEPTKPDQPALMIRGALRCTGSSQEAYGALARMAKEHSLNLWYMRPKVHMFQHVVLLACTYAEHVHVRNTHKVFPHGALYWNISKPSA